MMDDFLALIENFLNQLVAWLNDVLAALGIDAVIDPISLD